MKAHRSETAELGHATLASAPISLHLVSQSLLAILTSWKHLSHYPEKSSGRVLILQIIPLSVILYLDKYYYSQKSI